MNKEDVLILAIESSCDDTSVAILRNTQVISNIISSQEVHKKYGGIVPELASRSHEKNMIPVIHEALQKASVDLKDINAVAYTQGPGLPGSLIVGNAFAKSLSLALDIPIIAVNHMQAHVLAHFIGGVHEDPPKFPFLCLTVSGGHTQIVLVKDFFDLEVVGKTLDDAAGEAFDKIAKMLGIDYPGGPIIDKYAQKGDPNKFSFPKPKVDSFNYSFSGLKTAVLYFLRKEIAKNESFIKDNMNDLCASVQQTIVDILMIKLEKCASYYNINQIALAGGVSANSWLRNALLKREESLNWKSFVPPLVYCTDNAGMIGITAYYKYLNEEYVGMDSVAQARLYL